MARREPPTYLVHSTNTTHNPATMPRVKVVDKALLQFHNLSEWADYIAALARLQKLLVGHETSLDELAVGVALTLARCLLSQLPLGVHQKALGVYIQIFLAFLDAAINDTVELWLPGLFPVLSFGALAVKPVALGVIRDQVMLRLTPKLLEVVGFPLLCALLLGLEDETLETFALFHATVETYKRLVHDDAVFWQKLMLVVIRLSERRMGALRWVTRHWPKIAGDDISDEAKAILNLEKGGLAVRMFVAAIADDDIVVVRGFFDMLLTHWPLLECQKLVLAKDLQLLVMAVALVTLRRDMSLNRRLYTFLLGPLAPDSVAYFQNYGFGPLVQGILHTIKTAPNDAIRMLLLVAMDRWEISHLVIPKVFSAILQVFCSTDNAKITASCRQFFDAISPEYMWRQLITGDAKTTRQLVDNWEFPRDGNGDVELVLVALMFLDNHAPETLARLVSMCAAMEKTTDDNEVSVDDINAQDITTNIIEYYTDRIADNAPTVPYTQPQIRRLLVKGAVDLYNQSPRKYAPVVVDVCNLTATKLSIDDVAHDDVLAIQPVFSVVEPPLPLTLLAQLLAQLLAHDDLRQVPRLLDYFPRGQVEAGIFLELAKGERTRAYQVFGQLWVQFLHHDPEVLARPLQLVVDAVPDPSAVGCLAAICESLRRVPLILLLVTPPQDSADYGRWQYHFNLVVAMVDAVPRAREGFCDGDAHAKWAMVGQVDLLMTDDAIAEADGDRQYFDAVTAGLLMVLKLVTGAEQEFGDLAQRLFEATLRFGGRGVAYEAVQAKALDVLQGFPSLAKVGDAVVEYILRGVELALTPVVVEKWIAVLVRTLPMVGETQFFFAVVPFTKALIAKLDDPALVEVVFKGIKDMATISHSYARAHQGSAGVTPGTPQQPALASFLGKVFTIETPASEQEGRQRQAATEQAVRISVAAAVKVWNELELAPRRFWVKKLLTKLLDLEPKLVVELLVAKDNVRLVTIVDGGRQVVVRQLFDIVTTTSGQLQQRTLEFLVEYFRFAVDADSLVDIWPQTYEFLQLVATHKTALCGGLRLAVEVGHLAKPGVAPPAELAETVVKLVNLVLQMEPRRHEPATTLSEVLPRVLTIYGSDNDKLVATTNTVVYNVVTPELKRAKTSLALVPAPVIAIMATLGKLSPTKLWRQTVTDVFYLPLFFDTAPDAWGPVLRLWIKQDTDKFAELVAKAAPASLLILLWGEGLSAETHEKIGALKRVAYLLMIGDVDQFLGQFDAVCDQIDNALAMGDKVAPEYLAALTVMVRAMTVRFSELHLLPKWTGIIQLIMVGLRPLATADRAKLTTGQTQLALGSAKLLDQLLLLSYDEFLLAEWMFIGDTGVVAAIVRYQHQQKDVSTVAAVAIDSTYDHRLAPLLQGVKTIALVAALRQFFAGLKVVHYERVYSMQRVDDGAVAADVYADVFD